MDRFPIEIQRAIYEYDSTEREKFDLVIHQIRFIPVLKNITDWSLDPMLYRSNQWVELLFLYNKKHVLNTPEWVHHLRQQYWYSYIYENLLFNKEN